MSRSADVTLRVPRVKPVVVIMWIAFGLIALLHGPVDALGDFAESLSCMAGAAVMGNPGESAHSELPDGGSACRVTKRSAILPRAAVVISGFLRSQRWPTITAIQPITPDDALAELLANWQFWRRTALAARAPSPRV